MDSIICVKNGMRETLPDADKPWEQGISVTSEERDIVVLSFNKTVEVRLFYFVFRVEQLSLTD